MGTETRSILIPAHSKERGYFAEEVSLPWHCLHCGEPRGEPVRSLLFGRDHAVLIDKNETPVLVDTWVNPCGHVENYGLVRASMSQSITDAELLNLARRIWGDQATEIDALDEVAEVLDDSKLLLFYVVHPRPREALHALLTTLINLDQQETP